ncbi:hypothetical protein PAPYR_1164 [Paratrimastix pyriformis]|uniref:Uncharacterized protein n=1 Tax=Paratrimastix pyriformis TaxID=342808 RepID=A0ABQ8UTZ6_9EUKA|nr:hypothetical protein PAPYR_1164 [Paratrimastix pyriformis]
MTTFGVPLQELEAKGCPPPVAFKVLFDAGAESIEKFEPKLRPHMVVISHSDRDHIAKLAALDWSPPSTQNPVPLVMPPPSPSPSPTIPNAEAPQHPAPQTPQPSTPASAAPRRRGRPPRTPGTAQTTGRGEHNLHGLADQLQDLSIVTPMAGFPLDRAAPVSTRAEQPPSALPLPSFARGPSPLAPAVSSCPFSVAPPQMAVPLPARPRGRMPFINSVILSTGVPWTEHDFPLFQFYGRQKCPQGFEISFYEPDLMSCYQALNGERNGSSVVSLLADGPGSEADPQPFRMLFPGDVPSAVLLQHQGIPTRYDVIKVPHHGSVAAGEYNTAEQCKALLADFYLVCAPAMAATDRAGSLVHLRDLVERIAANPGPFYRCPRATVLLSTVSLHKQRPKDVRTFHLSAALLGATRGCPVDVFVGAENRPGRLLLSRTVPSGGRRGHPERRAELDLATATPLATLAEEIHGALCEGFLTRLLRAGGPSSRRLWALAEQLRTWGPGGASQVEGWLPEEVQAMVEVEEALASQVDAPAGSAAGAPGAARLARVLQQKEEILEKAAAARAAARAAGQGEVAAGQEAGAVPAAAGATQPAPVAPAGREDAQPNQGGGRGGSAALLLFTTI